MSNDIVKSVQRVFEVLAIFKQEQKPLTATDIVNLLGYPRSSALALMKSMMTLGYLSFDRNNHSYFPTLRLPLQTDWIHNAVYANTNLLALMEQLHNETGETVALSIQNNLQMQFIHILTGTHLVSLNLTEGQLVPIFHTAIGEAMLAGKSDTEMNQLIDYYQRHTRTTIDTAKILRQVRKARKRGYSIAYDQLVEGLAAIAAPLPASTNQRNLVLSIGGPSSRFKQQQTQLTQQLSEAIARHFPADTGD